jgi:hypothetical protein
MRGPASYLSCQNHEHELALVLLYLWAVIVWHIPPILIPLIEPKSWTLCNEIITLLIAYHRPTTNHNTTDR